MVVEREQGVRPTDTVDAIYKRLQKDTSGQFMDFELHEKAEKVKRILDLKQEKNAAILGHNYMEPALFLTVPDVRGDSLELARKASTLDKDVLVVAGVTFMAETVKLLNPDKKVLIPSVNGCSLAAGISAEDVRKIKEAYPGVPVITYINSYADVKAESDYCFTSGNANAVFDHVADEYDTNKIIVLPDEYYAENLANDTGMGFVRIKDTLDEVNGKRKMIPIFPVANEQRQVLSWDATCEVHEKFSVADVQMIKEQYPETIVMAHPECKPEVIDAVRESGGFAGGTRKMIDYINQHPDKQYALLTECSMRGNVESTTGADILNLCSVRCPHMAKITLDNTIESLEKLQYEITIPDAIADKARQAVERMLAIQ